MKFACLVSLFVWSVVLNGRPPKYQSHQSLAQMEDFSVMKSHTRGKGRDALANLVAATGDLATAAGDAIQGACKDGVDAIHNAGAAAVDTLQDIANQIELTLDATLTHITDAASKAVEKIKIKLNMAGELLGKIKTEVKNKIRTAFETAKGKHKAFKDAVAELKAAGKEAIEDKKPAIKTAVNDMVSSVADTIDELKAITKENLDMTVDTFVQFFLDTIAKVTTSAAKSAVNELSECVTTHCDASAQLLFGKAIEGLFSPVWETWDKQTGNETMAAETVAIYELTCGYGNVSNWPEELGKDAFAEALDFYSTFGDLENNFQMLDSCIKDKCADNEALWKTIQTGLPEHCSELLENPVRKYAGKYKVKTREGKFAATDTGYWLGKVYLVRLDCQGQMHLESLTQMHEYVTDTKPFMQPVDYIDVKDVCHKSGKQMFADTFPDSQNFWDQKMGSDKSTFYVQHVFDEEETVLVSNYDKTLCMYVSDHDAKVFKGVELRTGGSKTSYDDDKDWYEVEYTWEKDLDEPCTPL